MGTLGGHGGGGEGHEDIEEREHEGGTASWEVTRGWGGLKDMGGTLSQGCGVPAGGWGQGR